MPRVSRWFFAVGILYVIIGMLFGMYMGGSDDHTLYPAHAHLNLIGWVTMALYGTFYALAGNPAPRLAWVTFVLNNIGVLIFIPSIALILKYGELPQYIVPIVVGEVFVVLAAVSFAIAVWSYLFRR